jgi:uncharacterized protein (DUF983 family)
MPQIAHTGKATMHQSETPGTGPISFNCPHCSAAAMLTAVQGDRCPRCGLEFTFFEPDQGIVVRQFCRILTGEKYLCSLPGGSQVVAHG